jgi:hypothetical protein
MKLLNLRNIFTIFLFVVILVFVIVAAGYPFKAGIGPLAAGIPALILLIIVFVLDNTRKKAEETKSKKEIRNKENLERAAFTFSDYKGIIFWILGLLILSYLFGMILIFPLFTLIYIRVKGFSWRLSIIIAACVFVLMFVGYKILLQTPFHEGFIIEQVF